MSTETFDLSMLDLENFTSIEFDGELSTDRLRLDDGEYPAIVREVQKPVIKEFNGKKQLAMTVKFDVQADEFKFENRVDEVIRVKDFWLDIGPNGGLDKSPGKNVELGKFLEACGKNSGEPRALNSVVGEMVMIRIKNREGKDGIMRDNIQSIAEME